LVFTNITMLGAVWYSGKDHSLLLPGGKASKLLNRELALSMATGVSGGAAHTVPSLFFKDKSIGCWLNLLTNPSRQPDEKVDNEDCHVVSADGTTGKTILWIAKKNFLLKQIRNLSGDKPGEAVSQAASETSDDSLKKILKMTGQEVTPEAISKMRKQIETSGKMAGQFRVTSTQTFQNMVEFEIMEKEDFEYVVSADASAPAKTNSATVTTPSPPQKAEQPIFYTFGGETGFVKGPDGPIYSKVKVAQFGFTPLQVEEVNKITPRYYRDFLSLERQHTTVKTEANGRVHITIEPFRDEAIALAGRMVREIRGTTGKDIVPGGYDLRGVGIVGFLGLFRHEGTREVKVELWKDSAGYHFKESFGTDKDEFGGQRSGGSRTLNGKDWRQTFPEEYWIYWTEK
jgi:hypothetical protein